MQASKTLALPLVAVLALFGCEPDAPPAAPAAPPASPPAAAPVGANGLAAPPATPQKPVTDDYGGLKIVDPYRWLEDDAAADVKSWTDAQSKRARGFLDAWPGAAPLKAKIGKLTKGRGVEINYVLPRGSRLFAWKTQPPLQQPLIVTATSFDGLLEGKVVVDPNQLDKSGTTSMDFYAPSHDGKLVAVSLSKGGSESGDLHVFDAATGAELPDMIERVNGGTAGGDVAWDAHDKGFYYTRYPRKGERPEADLGFYQQLWFHKLGEKSESDRYVIGKEFPKIAEIALFQRDDGKYTLLKMANGDGGEFACWLAGPDGKFTQVTRFEDKIERISFGRDERLYALTRSGAPRGKIVATPVTKPDFAKAATVVPEGEGTIRGYVPAATKVYVVDVVGGPNAIRIFDLAGKSKGTLPLPAVPSVGQVIRLDKDEIVYQVETFLEPSAWYRFSGAGESTRTKIATKAPFDYADAEVTRETCTSKDGTKVPMSIVKKKGTPMDGARPTLLTGYGGFDISLQPWFGDDARIMIDAGGAFAVANIRGGGEFGEAWHQAGRLTKKQNVFDDFAACARRIGEIGLAKRDKLAILGGSNGGLLMGAMVTQHPDLARAVVSEVGLYDMMRSETFSNGAFNITEFGTVKNPAERDALFAYSPYHHVTDGTAYPAVLFTSGANDPRAAPWQSRKMTARLQASGSKEPVLFLSRDTGHGIGNSMDQAIADKADLFTFVFMTLGVEPMR